MGRGERWKGTPEIDVTNPENLIVYQAGYPSAPAP